MFCATEIAGGVFDEGTLSGVDGCSGWSCQTSGTVRRSCPGAARPPAPSTTASFRNTSSRPGRDPRDAAALSQPRWVGAAGVASFLILPASLEKEKCGFLFSFFSFFNKSHVKSCTPDYSQVKPKVNFPKVSSKSPKGESLPLRTPTGADSVEEDSWDRLDMSPATPDSAGDGQKLGSSREETRLLCELEVRFQPERVT